MITDETAATLADLVNQGLTVNAISRELGLGPSAVRRRLVRAGISTQYQRRKRQVGSSPRAVRAAELRREGMPLRKIAKRLGVVESTIRYWLETGSDGRQTGGGSEPTPEEIRRECEKIQAGWDENTRHDRAGANRVVECDYGIPVSVSETRLFSGGQFGDA